ncbi:MAG: DUF433 domain-containing protein [Proteobacteria bacterium]|nr:DUF433 domain-containing protein [Pseudomonadota bacterium]
MSLTSVETKYEHIVLDEKDVPIIAGTSIKVIELVLEKSAYGWSPEELHFQHPYLTLGEIYSALAYYWDHQKELDSDIEYRLATVAQTRQKMEPSKLMQRLKSEGLI